MTKTFLTSTGFAAPFTTPLSRYAFALGALCDWALLIAELERSRTNPAFLLACAWLLAYRHLVDDRVVNVRAGVAGARA
jgi:hypothetical protein